MTKPSAGVQLRSYVRTIRALIVAVIAALMVTPHLAAHEVTPSVSDITISESTISLDIRLNLESFVAGIDLQSLDDTDNTDTANDYDKYRVMSPAELETSFRTWWPQMADRFSINAPDRLETVLRSVEIPEVGNVDLPRESTLRLTAERLSGAQDVTITWPAEFGALIIRQQGVESPYTGYLEGGGVSEPIPAGGVAEKTAWQYFLSYVPVGFDHIVPRGLDHILFVLGLFFLGTRFSTLLWQISLFTLAHTVTLVMGSLGWINVPANIVEPLIAASIVYVACENLFTETLHSWRSLLIFGFGLLHGLGFASVLGEFGLPSQGFIPALLGFNVGVEIGQLAVVAVAFFAVGIWFRKHPKYRPYIAMPASVLIALTGAWWLLERTVLA